MITDVIILPLLSNESGMFSRCGMNGVVALSRLRNAKSNRTANAAGANASARMVAFDQSIGEKGSVSIKEGNGQGVRCGCASARDYIQPASAGYAIVIIHN